MCQNQNLINGNGLEGVELEKLHNSVSAGTVLVHLINFFSIVIILRISSMSSQYASMCPCNPLTPPTMYMNFFHGFLILQFLSKFTTLVGRGMFHCVIDAMLRGGIFALDCRFSIHDFFHFQTKQSSSAIIFDHWDIFLPVNKNFSALKPIAQ